jgi:hypothetical protein
MSRSKDGTALGASLLWRRFERQEPITSVTLDPISPEPIPNLREAAQRWRALADQKG